MCMVCMVDMYVCSYSVYLYRCGKCVSVCVVCMCGGCGFIQCVCCVWYGVQAPCLSVSDDQTQPLYLQNHDPKQTSLPFQGDPAWAVCYSLRHRFIKAAP